MKIRYAVAGITAVALLPSGALAAKKPPAPPASGPTLSLGVSKPIIVVPGSVVVSGVLANNTPRSGVEVSLEADDTRPYGDSFKPTGAKTSTATNGGYAFTLRPTRNTQYRTVAKASPTVTSGAAMVLVRPLVGIKASTRTPAAGRFVRFSGLVSPARNGALVQLQRRGSTGRYITIARATLRASNGNSIYAVSARIRTSGTYRVKLPSNGILTNGFSRLLSITVR